MSATQAYGANIAFIEELYERYRANPDSVSPSWREFFHDYGVAAGFSRPNDEDGRLKPAATQPPPETPALRLAGATPLRGAAAKIAANMEASLRVPTATSIRDIPAKVLEENRRIINNHLVMRGHAKASYTN